MGISTNRLNQAVSVKKQPVFIMGHRPISPQTDNLYVCNLTPSARFKHGKWI